MNPSPPGPNPHQSILVVDDDETMRAAMYNMFSAEYGMVMAVDGIDGCERADLQAPDLIISDVAMPRLDGIGMIRRMREHLELRDVPIIFLTAKMSAADVIAGQSVHPFAYLSKSTDPGILER